MATIRTLIGNIKGPKGDTGIQGPQGNTGPGATITVGSVSTTDYGNPVQITNSGTATDAILDFVIPQGKPGEKTTQMSTLTLDTITTQSAAYPIPAVGDTGATAWGKIVKFFNDIRTAVTGKVDKTSIVNNLTSTATDAPLAAAQGKALNDALGNKIRFYHKTHTVTTDANGAFNIYNLSNADNPSAATRYSYLNLIAVYVTGVQNNVYCVIGIYNSAAYCFVKNSLTNAAYANQTFNVDIVSYSTT